jgi:ubiquinone/menaquinone biosynthesis C-methylase UbiE
MVGIFLYRPQGENVNPLLFGWRICERYLRGRRTTVVDIARDYDRAANTYNSTWLEWMEPVQQELLNKLAPLTDGKVLDLGCGTGLMQRYLQRQGFNGTYLGIDASASMLAQFAKEPWVETLHGDVHEWLPSLPGQSYDLITALWSWEYLRRYEVLPQIRRLLRPGGQVLLLANRYNTIPELQKAFLQLMAARPKTIGKVFHLAFSMPRSAAQMGGELVKTGFRIKHQAQGECLRRHASAEAAVVWGYATGALAGTRCVLDLPDLEVQLAAELRAKNGMFLTTHRYAGVVGELPC